MEQHPSNPNTKNILSEWLEQIQQDSWQLELLISGLALYGVYNGIDKVEDYSSFIGLNIDGPVLGIPFVFSYFIAYVGWRIFFFNLLIHVILRGLWIASIGLRYVSNEINFDALNYAPAYTKYLKERIGSYDQFIEKLEKLCSIIFAFTFLMFLLLVSLMIFTAFAMIPLSFLDNTSSVALNIIVVTVVVIYIILGSIVAIDFISLGSIKKIREPWVVKAFTPVFKFYSYLTLSFMYRPILYNFLDQKYTRKFFLLIIPYVAFLGGGDRFFSNHINPYLDSDNNLMQEGLAILDYQYEDLLRERILDMSDYRKKRYINTNSTAIRLSNYKIKNNQLEFFVKTARLSKLLKEKYKLDPIYKPGLQFNLFVNHKREIPGLKAISKKYHERYNMLRKNYNKERVIISERADTNGLFKILKNKRDSINDIIDSLEVLKEEEIVGFELKNNGLIFEKIQSTIQVKIDSLDYSERLSCKYFKDKFVGSDGILCNLFDESLPKGNKIVEFTRQYYNQFAPDSIGYSKTKIPVYIE